MTKRRRRAIVAVVLAIAVVVGLSLALDNGSSKTPAATDSIVGRHVAGFTLEGLNGKVENAPWTSGKTTLVLFFADWCAPCHEELPVLVHYFATHTVSGLSIVGVDADSSIAVASKFTSEDRVDFPVVLDPNENVSGGLFDFVGFPDSALVSSAGTILRVQIGALSTRTLRAWIGQARED
jgi:thiol-disulfide isomerase/thioredoxin